MTVRTFLLPDLGEGLTEADIIRWLVAAGDTVTVDQPIVEVETAKSLVEVPSPFGGIVTTLHAEAGTTLDVGKPLVSVDDGVGSAPADAGSGSVATTAAPTDADWAGTVPLEGAQSYTEEERAGVHPETAAEAGLVAADSRSAGAGAEDDGGSGNVLIGYGTPGGAAKGRTRRRKGSDAGSPTAVAGRPAQGTDRAAHDSGGASVDGPSTHAAFSQAAEQTHAGVRGAGTPGTTGAPVRGHDDGQRQAPRVVNPLVRKMARDHAVDLSAVRGSGPGGLVMRADVMAAVGTHAVDASGADARQAGVSAPLAGEAALAASSGPTGSAGAAAPAGEVDARTGLGVAGVEKVTGVRKVTAAAMSRSRREIPEATVWVDVDVTPLMDLRASMKARGDQEVPGVLAFASRFALAGLAKYPALAQRFEEDGEGGHRIVSFNGINLGVAVQSERGLVVPSIRGAHRMSARQLQGELRRLTELARSGRGTPKDLSGGTFTINNYGIFGTDGSAAIINHPEVAILGMGRIIDRPWVVDGQLAVRKVMQLSLVFDHRVCDGGAAGGFLRFVADCFENPVGLLADM